MTKKKIDVSVYGLPPHVSNMSARELGKFPRNLIRTSRQCPFFPYCIQVINRQGNNFSSKDETIHSQNGHLHGFEQQPLPSSLLLCLANRLIAAGTSN